MGNVIFYNHFGNGDLFISKEFVRDIMNIIPADNYYYAHAKNSRMFADIPQLKYINITDNCQIRSRYAKIDEDIYINTWMGVDSQFVTRANSCSILNAFNMYCFILEKLGFKLLTQSLENYLPTVDYTAFDVAPVLEFAKDINQPMILIANCNAQSGQAENFDTTMAIQRLCDTYKDIEFIVSDPVIVKASNYITTAEITKSKDGFDLNELSYLSKFCSLFIGRSSGAQIFAMTRDNCMDPNKAFLSFTKMRESAHIVWLYPEIAARIYWSDLTNINNVFNYICGVVEKERKRK